MPLDAFTQDERLIAVRIHGFGKDDFLLIADLPGNVQAAAGSLVGSSSGAISVRTTPLLTPEEVDAAAKQSATYRPPGA